MMQVSVKTRLGGRGEKGLLLDVEFAASEGITILSGPSGAGKTSTLRLIAGILKPDEGRITNDNVVYYDSQNNIDLPMQQRNVGFVFQDYALFPHLTAEQNVSYGVKVGVDKKRTALELLELFHIAHLKDRLPREMSGGEQQRTAIARAIASSPSVMLMDEPLSAVDIETRVKLLDEIEALQRRIAIPFIYVTHNFSESERLGKHRVWLESGRVVSIS